MELYLKSLIAPNSHCKKSWRKNCNHCKAIFILILLSYQRCNQNNYIWHTCQMISLSGLLAEQVLSKLLWLVWNILVPEGHLELSAPRTNQQSWFFTHLILLLKRFHLQLKTYNVEPMCKRL